MRNKRKKSDLIYVYMFSSQLIKGSFYYNYEEIPRETQKKDKKRHTNIDALFNFKNKQNKEEAHKHRFLHHKPKQMTQIGTQKLN